MSYKVIIDEDALDDIQQATDWYNQALPGLGFRFQQVVKSQVNRLKENPLVYTVRYASVHCMRVKKFPFLVHYKISKQKKIVEIFAVIHTSRNPRIWKKRFKRK